ncbi:MAG: FliH/SctL family protein [Chlamydiota bacterium]
MSKKYFSLIYSGDIQQSEAHNSKVIAAADFSELLSATEVLQQTHQDIATYLEENKKECAQLLEKAKEAGFNQGLTEFNKQILHYEQKIKEIEHSLQSQVLPIALKAAKRIVGGELKSHPEAIVDIVRKTLKPVTQNHHIKIYVNKADKGFLEEEKGKLKESLEQVKTFAIEERDDIEAGGCIIETEAGIINASLENQWRALESAFEAFMKS